MLLHRTPTALSGKYHKTETAEIILLGYKQQLYSFLKSEGQFTQPTVMLHIAKFDNSSAVRSQ